jgi:CheY-like chemotaxis protein
MTTRKLRVLVAEDEALIALALRYELEARGHEVTMARDGQEALEAAERLGSFDALVTDMQMPRLRGDELVRRLRAERPDLAILVVSANVCPETVTALQDLPGPLTMLTKPCSFSMLTKELERLAASGLAEHRVAT